MDTASVIQIISNIGFPIACAVALFIAWQKDRETQTQALDKMRDAVENNTQVMLQLLDKFNGGPKK